MRRPARPDDPRPAPSSHGTPPPCAAQDSAPASGAPHPRGAPAVRCLPRGSVLRPAPDESLLEAARRAGVPLASSCSGAAVCGDCLVAVVGDPAALAPPDADELAWRTRRGYGGTGRLACRARAVGNVAIATTYW